MKNISEFFRTTAVSKLELVGTKIEELLGGMHEPEYRALPSSGSRPGIRRLESVNEKDRDKRAKQFSMIQKASMRHRSIFLDGNDAGIIFINYSHNIYVTDLVKLRLAYAQGQNESPSSKSKPMTIPYSTSSHNSDSSDDETRLSKSPILKKGIRSNDNIGLSPSQQHIMQRMDMTTFDGMQISEVIAMLNETEVLEEQASVVHYLWMKR